MGKYATKHCSQCQRDLDRSNFYIRRNGYLLNPCKGCLKQIHAEWYLLDPQRQVANAICRKFKISLKEYTELLEKSQGRCAICQREGQRQCIDHDHVTGKIRGVVCDRCNTLIGFVENSRALLPKIEEYLGLV